MLVFLAKTINDLTHKHLIHVDFTDTPYSNVNESYKLQYVYVHKIKINVNYWSAIFSPFLLIQTRVWFS